MILFVGHPPTFLVELFAELVPLVVCPLLLPPPHPHCWPAASLSALYFLLVTVHIGLQSGNVYNNSFPSVISVLDLKEYFS